MSQLLNTNSPVTDNEFKLLIENPKWDNDREFIENLWQKYEPYADKHFQTEVAINFHNRFWEMYLSCCLLEQGLKLTPRTSRKGPDIHLASVERNVWIEAIAPKGGTGPDALQEPALEVGKVHYSNVPEEKIILRYQSAIHEKFNKYQGYIGDEIIKQNEPYIIAINGRRIPYSILEDDIPYIVKSVLPFGDLNVIINWESDKIIGEEYSYRPEINKAHGAQVSTRIFLDASFSGISGILFSNSDFLNHPHKIGNEFIFIHNPLANNPMSPGWLPIGREFQVKNDVLEVKNWNANL